METTQTAILVAGLVAALTVILVVVMLAKSRGQHPEPSISRTTVGGLGEILRRVWDGGLDDSTWERLEEALIAADVGVEASARVVDRARSTMPGSVEEAHRAVAAAVLAEFGDTDRRLDLGGSPSVIIVVGVNGSGKTTTIGKLARMLGARGHTVTLAAADTFRAAAREQLTTWGERVRVPVVTGQEGGDPASVAHDAITSARARGSEVVIVDTAGRLQSKKNLMEELSKIHRVAVSASRVGEVLLVLDASGGQNGLSQAREFAAAVPITGLVLTKLDGTARGGIVVAVEAELGIPVKLVGTGEGIDDLQQFEPRAFVADLTSE